jgi:hypothetical protein
LEIVAHEPLQIEEHNEPRKDAGEPANGFICGEVTMMDNCAGLSRAGTHLVIRISAALDMDAKGTAFFRALLDELYLREPTIRPSGWPATHL